jgi:pimeloyl-ACP methyl ester carboxylesterase
MTRPSLLALLASTLSGCGAARALTRAAEVAHGCVDVPVPAANGVRVVRHTFASAHVRGPVNLAIAVPEADPAPVAVAYLLPGRGSDAGAAMGLGFDGFLAAWLRAGGAPFAIAAVDAGESYFHARRGGEDRLALVRDELPAAVANALGTIVAREALIGQSMGGYGALLAAEREPQRYRAVAVAGPAIFPSYEDEHRSVGDAFDSAADYARYDVIAHASALRGRPVQIWCGRRDPFLPGVRAFARACPTAELHVDPGCHDEGFWRATAAAVVAFIGAHV